MPEYNSKSSNSLREGSTSMKKILVLVTVLACWVLVNLNAQSAVSQISGMVQDSTGSAIPGAQVTLTNTDTGATRTVESGADGSYVFTNVLVGPYRLQVTKEGFSAYSQSGIVIQVNSNPQINVSMKVGAVTETIEVQANATMLETVNTSVGQVIDQQRVVELPLNGRNVTQLITLSGAAVSIVNAAGTGTGGIVTNLNYPTVAAFSVAGSQGNATNYFLDGGVHLDVRTNVGLPLPFPDALQEFKVETSSLPANFGNQPGGAVNVVTKSGTNSLHGNLFYFVRNGAMNARNFFAPVRDSLKRNQFGGVIGGPVIKDKLFFFAGYQGTLLRTAPATNVAFVPTAAVRQGDFRAILDRPCQANPVTLSSSVASGNILLPGVASPITQRFMDLLPVATDPCGRITYGVPTIANEHQGITRMDWQRTSRDLIFARYYATNYNLKAYYDGKNILTASAPGLSNQVQAILLGDTFLLNPTTVSSFRASLARSAVQRVGADGVPNMAQLGAPVYSPIPNYTGQIQIAGYFNSGAIPGYVYSNMYNVSEDIAMNRGAHQINFGVNWNLVQMNSLGPFQMNPRMTFNGQRTGNALADFVTGRMFSMLQGNGQVGRDVMHQPSLYVQDNWKILPRFQMNVGIRWDPFLPQSSKYGYAAIFNPAAFAAGTRSSVFVNAPAGMTFPGDAGFPGQKDAPNRWGIFSPRFGFVWDPRGKGREIIRGGYGIFYGSTYMWNTMHITLNPPWGSTVTVNAPDISNPWANYPGGNPFPTPTRFPSNHQFPSAGTFKFYPENARPTYLQQWNLSFQRQFGQNWLISATYLGNKTTHQWLGHEINPAVFGTGATVGNTQARRVFNTINPTGGALYGSVIQVDDGGNASYNGLLLALNHRFSQGFSLLANYTYSHCLNQGEANQDIASLYQNPYDRRAEWGNCSADRRQIFNMSGVVRSPKFSSKWTQRIAGNWQMSGIYNYISGPWLNITTGTDTSLTAVGQDRPAVIGDWRATTPTLNRWFNIDAFRTQTTGTYGNAGRNIVLGPSAWTVDAALWRTFPVNESLKVDFRWEVFNIFNHARFNPPNTARNAGNFGQITTAQDPRIMQLALKVTF
jgi:hypothetical protein